MKIISLLLTILVIATSPAWAEGEKYTCPMHPHYIANDMGTCPICGMDLVPIAAATDEDKNADAGEKKILYWVAPMDANYRRDEPGKSPMGMDLVPVYAAGSGGSIRISPETIQTIGVRTAKVENARFGTTVRSVGIVEPNKRAQQELSSRVAGWIEDLKIEAVGDTVAKGDVLYRMYSPELISAQKDYTSALAIGVKERIKATRKRLEFLGVQTGTLDNIAKSRKMQEKMPFYAQSTGTVSHVAVREGSYVKPGDSIARIEDYSDVWIEASIAEKDIPFIAQDATAEVSFPNLGNQTRTARVDYIYPTIDAATRTGKVRLILPNKDGNIRPGAYADVVFETNPKLRLSVPTQAILHDSSGEHVVVAIGNGKFTPRTISIGITNRGHTEVISGLQVDENVVISSQFLIDSESSLRESLTKMKRLQQPLSTLPLTKDQLAMINHFVDAALYLHESLTGGAEFNQRMLDPALQLNARLLRSFHETTLEPVIGNAGKAIRKASESITESKRREALAALMRALNPWLMEGKPQYYKDKGLHLFMSMPSKAMWLQLEAEAKNPYAEDKVMPHEWPKSSETMKMGGGHAE